VLAEPIPTGVLTPKAILREPPATIAAAEILPENLPDGWSEGQATALSIATALSQKFGHIMPWKTVKDVITASLSARFTELDGTSRDWPCDYPAAQSVKLKVASVTTARRRGGGMGPMPPTSCLVAHAELEPSEIQDLADIIPSLLELKAKFNTPLKFRVQIELGDGKQRPSEETTREINKLLKALKHEFELQ
jgi:hypothetical protein